MRVVSATALFDGHDAAIHIVRRLLMSRGAEVIHLGHDRSVDEIVSAAIQEEADAIAVSSYQGGHMEFFRYLVDELRARDASDILVFGGGGGTILPDEAAALRAYGVSQVFGPREGLAQGLDGMIDSLLGAIGARGRTTGEPASFPVETLDATQHSAIAACIGWFETEAHARVADAAALRARLAERATQRASTQRTPVIGVTGTGGAGKSSVVDELVRRIRHDMDDLSLALLLVDPTRRRSGGALLGDRIRMNAIHGPQVYVRSLATRSAHGSSSKALADALQVLHAAQFDVILIETAGIGQSDSQIVDCSDVSLYVMTSDYGAPSQLEKIDMIELADLVILNKFDRPGAQDALRDVRKQWKRNHLAFQTPNEAVPVLPCVARAFADPGCDQVYVQLQQLLAHKGFDSWDTSNPRSDAPPSTLQSRVLIPAERTRYLAEITSCVRGYRENTRHQTQRAGDAYAAYRTLRSLGDTPPRYASYPDAALDDASVPAQLRSLRAHYNTLWNALAPASRQALGQFAALRNHYVAERQTYRVRDRDVPVENFTETLAHLRVPKVALPPMSDWGTLLAYLCKENLPGRFPFTAGVFPFRRQHEDPTRMFAGEGSPERTNRRFHLLARGARGVRLSTAFDSVTLYGRDPDQRPDIFGKIGNAGVSVCTVDDAKKLYSGFDLCDANTSVSMTINGPAPILLACFLNAAIDQQVERHLQETGQLDSVRMRSSATALPRYDGVMPEGHDGLGLGLLGIPGDAAVSPETYARIRADVLRRVRGTVQADILKEDQAQNTCIFATDFALRMMGDVQDYFCTHGVGNFYSVSISGYHMAEAGANPITQLAFTLANAFTYCEYYRSRGMRIDDFAANLSFFFSHGLDAEYQVLGRVARRIWAIAMRDCYGAGERSQKLKYHIQTSGRSLHAQEMAFNDIRTTLQAASALWDNCNSLHTNAFDEAITTPTEASVRRAMAIQLIIQRELGLYANENPLQGSYAIEALTDAVEDAVLDELDRIAARGGVLGAMETLYQRSKIQEESLHYENLKHSGALPIVGVNTFVDPAQEDAERPTEVMRSTEAEKHAQLAALEAFHRRGFGRAEPALLDLQREATRGGNVFAVLMETVKYASLGQISEALFEVGGRYRRCL